MLLVLPQSLKGKAIFWRPVKTGNIILKVTASKSYS